MRIQKKNTAVVLFFIWLCLLPAIANSQPEAAIPVHDISRIKYKDEIRNDVLVTFINQAVLPADFATQDIKWKLLRDEKKRLSPSLVTQKAVLFFKIENNSDSAHSVYFFPGRYFKNVSIYFADEKGTVKKLDDIFPAHINNLSYRKITLSPHQAIPVYIVLGSLKTYTSSIRPQLINEFYIDSFIREEENFNPDIQKLTFIICGLMMMMILFSLANYFQGANKEFLYYAGYALFLGLMLLTKALIGYNSSRLNFFMEEYFDFILFCTGHLFYLGFLQRFLNAEQKHKFVYRLCKVGITALIAAAVIYTILHYFTNFYLPEYYIENVTKLLLLVLAAFFVVYARRHWNDKIFRFLAWGHGCMFVFSCLSYLFTLANLKTTALPAVFTTAIFHYELGILFELIFFLAGLSYKNKREIIEQTRERERLKSENQMKEYEKQLAVLTAQKEERTRISADMHDELGSGMTAIRLMSELAKAKMKENSPAEIDRISDSANDVLNKMNAIIWSMNSGNDTLDNLISYIRSYTLEYLENTTIHCTVKTPAHIEPKELSGDKRRNIFLCVKETLNNALKHSGASEINMSIEVNHQLVIRIQDNGKGIDLTKLRQFGTGLKNIQQRMKNIGGAYSIENKNGTLTTLSLPL